MKLANILKDIVKDRIDECTVAAVRFADNIVLAKNRDRGYVAKIEMIHGIENGVEVVYWHDTETDWSEGINEFGIGVVNSSLMVHQDEKESKEVEKGKKDPKHAKDGAKIRAALSQKNIRDVVKVLLNTTGNDGNVKGVTGQSLVSDGKDVYVIEHTSQDAPIVRKLKNDRKVVVRTNHGIYHPHVGYVHGPKKVSSHVRLKTAQAALEQAEHPDQVLDILKKKYWENPFLNPYRTENPFNMETVGQIMMDLVKKEIQIRLDKDRGEFEGLQRDLPNDYEHKIKIKIHKHDHNNKSINNLWT